MNYKIYKPTRDGLELIDSTNDWAVVSAYKGFRLNIVIRDTANDLPGDLDTITCEQYGIRGESTMFSACVVIACAALTPILILIGILTNN